jgi:hypothetical protein
MRALVCFGVFLLTLLPGGRAMAFGACTEPGYLARFQAGLAPQPCEDIHYVTVHAASGDALLRIIRLARAAHGDDEVWRTNVIELASSLGRAIDAIGTARLPDEITVFLSDGRMEADELDEVHADTTRIPGGECRVTFYKLSGGADAGLFVFSLAHEIFHCAQFETWLSAARVADAGWWVEGSAEYFAQLARPGTPYGDGWVEGFDEDSLSQSLVAMEYQNVVFFSWLANRGGPEAVGAFLAQMRPGSQLEVLRGLVPLADWTSFVETWLDGGVSLPGGRTITPGPMAQGERVFRTSGTLDLRAGAYVIERWGATFPEDNRFDLTYEASGSPSQARMRLLGATGGWAEPPERINTCEGEERHILYFTTVDGSAEAVLTVETDDDETGGTCCLAGSWSPTQETLEGFSSTAMQIGAAAIAAQGANLSCGYASGGWVLTFGDGGSGALDYEANTNICVASGHGGAISFDETRNGTIGFDWEVVGEGAGMAHYTENSLGWSIVMHMGPVTHTQEGADAGPSIGSNGFAFTCDGDALTIRGIYGVSSAEATYLRFAE